MTSERSHELTDVQQQDRTTLVFWLFAGFHLVLWMLVPTLTQPNAPLDTIEMLYWGHEWQLGYYKHPPMPGWIAEASCMIFGQGAWATYLAAQLLVVTCFWAAWQLARDFLKPWHALAAALVLEGSYYYNYTTPELNNNVVSRAFWALSVLCFYRAVSRGHLRWWVLTGLSLAVGMMSRYDTALLAMTMLGFTVANSSARAYWRSGRPAWTIVTCIVFLAPHLYWLVESDFPTIRYFLRRSDGDGGWVNHIVYPLKFLVSQLGATLPILLVAIPIVRRWRRREIREPAQQFQRDFLLSIVLGPVAIILGASLLVGFKVRSMWGTALWTFAGLLALYLVELRSDRQAMRRLVTTCAMTTLVIASILFTKNLASPHMRGKGSRVHFPGQQLAEQVQRRWQQDFDQPLQFVGGPWWLAGNVAFYADHRASVFADLQSEKSPWLDDTKLQEQGGVIVWQKERMPEDFQASLAERYPHADMQAPVVLDWQTSADLEPIEVQVAVVPPRLVVAQRRSSTQPSTTK